MSYRGITGGSVELVLGSQVADDGTVAVAYPSGFTQGDFLAGGEKYGSSYVILNDNDKLAQGHPSVEFSYGASTVTITNRSGVAWAAGTKVRAFFATWPGNSRLCLAFPVSLDTVTAADVVTDFRPGINGYITHMSWVTDVAPSASDAATFNLEIGTTDVTGGVIVLDSTAAGAKGTVVQSTQITANNRLTKASLLAIEASTVTDYASGSGTLYVFIQPDSDGD